MCALDFKAIHRSVLKTFHSELQMSTSIVTLDENQGITTVSPFILNGT